MSRQLYRALFVIIMLLAVHALSGAAEPPTAPVDLCVDPDWFPFERINEQGKHEGIAADLLQLASDRSGISFRLVRTASWDESLAASKAGRCQALSFLNDTPQRRSWLIFTDTLLTDPNVFITREEHPFITDPAFFVGETLVLPSGTSIEERIRAQYPGLLIRTVDSEAEALRQVSSKQADITLRSLTMAAYTIKKDGWFNLKIAGELPGYQNELRLGIDKNQPELRERLNRAIQTITPQERWQIINRHISINVQAATDYSLVIKLLVAFSVLAVAGFYWNYQLKQHNRELTRVSQTDVLTGLPNRARLNQAFQAEIERCRRYSGFFSILLLDIDNFKAINDEFGHIMGDEILKEFARLGKDRVRSTDIFGRWGGEEFLVLCPETPLPGSVELAEKLRRTWQDHIFSTQRQHTASIGVAVYTPGETMDALLRKADLSLYHAKAHGKNQVSASGATAADLGA